MAIVIGAVVLLALVTASSGTITTGIEDIFAGGGGSTSLPKATKPSSHFLIPPVSVSRTTRLRTTSYTTECQYYGQYCRRALVQILNLHRAAINVAPLLFDKMLTWGANGCVGSQGHSRAMAATGTIWHISPSPAYDSASFYRDIYPGCITSYTALGENAGEYPTTNRYTAIQQIDNLMMQEQHDSAYCTQLASSYSSNHACTILSALYAHVGVGLVDLNGTIYLTEDFH